MLFSVWTIDDDHYYHLFQHKLWKPPEEDVTVADLWFGFLRYYLFEFDREQYVVTIKQKSRLDRLGKLWESLLAVEGRSDSFTIVPSGNFLNALLFLGHFLPNI